MAVVSAALAKQPGPDRDAFVDQACAGDVDLTAKVQDALSHSEPGEITIGPTEFVGTGEGVGARIGPYKILQEIGEGGCGVVYQAEQQEPIRRRVALKIIKLGMDSRQVIARFEAERQALAMMDHPNIATVLDAGTTRAGRPYFVMELVRGIPITRYCDDARLPTHERLKLFIEVCKAIQHAHQKGIIHRDIKPSNILVTLQDGAPVPKVIDFGIAKATEGKLTDKTLYTAFEQFIGTPAYMSPEQAGLSALDIDTRSDIYSLGVLLYELLIGRTPFEPEELARAGIDEARRRIREQDPPKPSTRLRSISQGEATTTANRRGTSPPELVRGVSGDLDWIVMKALEKERTRRYDTAGSLAKDIEHFLNNEPVLARPPCTSYRIRKFARRNRVAFAATVVMVVAACIVVVALTVGLALSTWLLLREREARRLASEAQQEAALTQAEVLAFGNPELIERVTRARESQGQLQQATELLNQGQLVEAGQVLDGILGPGSAGGSFDIQVLELRADLRARQGRFQEAATDLQRLVEIDPDDHWHWFILAPLLVQLGEDATYESLRKAMLARFGDTDVALTAERVAKAASLRPVDEADAEVLNRLLETVRSQANQEDLAGEFAQYRDAFMLCEALVQYRHGSYEEAAQSAQSALKTSYPFFVPTALGVLSMSRCHQQRLTEAHVSLDTGRNMVRDQFPRLGGDDLGQLWNDVLIAEIILNEASELLETQTSRVGQSAPPIPE